MFSTSLFSEPLFGKFENPHPPTGTREKATAAPPAAPPAQPRGRAASTMRHRSVRYADPPRGTARRLARCVAAFALVAPATAPVPAAAGPADEIPHGTSRGAVTDAASTAGPAVPTDATWPLAPHGDGDAVTVTRGFDPPAFRYGPGHRGLDLGGEPGQAVHAAAAGVVAFSGPVAGHGVVSIDHPSGLRTTYQPLNPIVTAGDAADAGSVIGTLSAGHPGCPRAACLHWGLRDGRDYLDPRLLLGSVTVRLLPV